MVVEEKQGISDVAQGPARERQHAVIRRAGKPVTQDLVSGWLGCLESAGQSVPERLSHLGNDLGAFVTVEHVLDKRPLQCVAGPATQGSIPLQRSVPRINRGSDSAATSAQTSKPWSQTASSRSKCS